MLSRSIQFACMAGLLGLALPTWAQEETPAPVFTELRSGVFMIEGPGNNMLLAAGADGVLLVDSDFARNAEGVAAAIVERVGRAPDIVVNTHYHGDHAGGNAVFAGSGGHIIAHENMRRRFRDGLTAEGRVVRPPAPAEALPRSVYGGHGAVFFNGEEVRLIHPGPAHTDGDTIVFLTRSNVIHMGDLFFNGGYPFIDTASGGDVDGYIAAQELALSLADEQTRIVPGHGPLATKADLARTTAMLRVVRARISALIDRGVSEADAVASNPLADLNDAWPAFYPADRFVRMVYRGLSAR